MESQVKSSAMGDTTAGAPGADTVKRIRRIVSQYRVFPMDVAFDEGECYLPANTDLGIYSRDGY